jgi:hypothetical protein
LGWSIVKRGALMKRVAIILALLALPLGAHAEGKFMVRGYGQQPCTELQGLPHDLTNEALAKLPLPMQLKTLTLFGWILGFASAEDEKATSEHLPGRVSSKFSDSEIVKAVIMACEKSNSKNDPSDRWTISDATLVALSGLIMQSK